MKQNVLRRLGALVLTFALALSLTVTPAWAAAIPVDKVVLNNLSLPRNSSGVKITGTVTYTDGSTSPLPYNEIQWYIEPQFRSIVDITLDGTVIPRSLGTATVSATYMGFVVDCTVTVTSPGSSTLDPTGIKLEPNGPMNDNNNGFLLTLEGANSGILKAVVTNGSGMKVQWTTSNAAVASVRPQTDNDTTTAVVTAEGRGHAVITATLLDSSNNPVKDSNNQNITAQFPVDVYDYRMELKNVTSGDTPVSSLSFNLDKDKTCTLSAAVIGSDATVRDHIIWKSSNPSIIRIEETNITSGAAVFKAMSPGTARITASRTVNGVLVTGYCDIIVPTPGTVSVQSVTLNKKELTLGLNGTETLIATVSPSNARDKTVEWTSSSSIVASVDQNGKVTANSVGTATIRVTSKSDYTKYAECVVTVKPGLTSLSIKNTTSGRFELNANMTKPGDTQMIEAMPYPANAYFTYDSVTWTSDKPGVIKVEKDSREKTGLAAKLTFAGPGEAEITVKSGDVKGTCKITVPGVVLQSGVLTMTNNRLTMNQGQTETLTYQAYGRAQSETGTTAPNWRTTDSAIVDVDRNTGKLTARKPGTATITLTLGSYSAECVVTVSEDTSALIQAGTINAGSQLRLVTLASQLNSISFVKTGATLSYITNLSVPTAQGILHNNHRSEADTGAGVGASERYYPSKTTGPDALSALYFVPQKTFDGIAEITYTGWSTNGQAFNGTIRVTVRGLGTNSDVAYSSDGTPVSFLADDFNIVSNAKTGHNLKYVTFTPPQSSVGTLYYNYISESRPGEKVASDTQYFRTSNPSLDKVAFVPAQGYSGTVRIPYRATDTSNNTYTGTVTITVSQPGQVSGPADIYYSTDQGSWATLWPNDFAYASQRAIGQTLSHVRFDLPPSSEGTLFYNYQGFGSNGGMVSSTTSYYRDGSPSLGNVSFVPTTTSPAQVDITYTGYGIRGTTFTGTIHITVGGAAQQGGTRYTVRPGGSVYFNGADFYNACQNATGKMLYYVRFTSLPPVGAGTLRYSTRNGTGSYTVSTNTSCYYNNANAAAQLSNVYFQAASSYTGTVRIPYKGYCTDNTSFDGEVVIYVTNSTSNPGIHNPVATGSRYFSDMDSHTWAVPAVDYLYLNGVVNGSSATGYGPRQQVLRRDFVVMLCRAFGFSGTNTSSFADVPRDAYYSQAIATARDLNIVSGSGRNFSPNTALTREDAMVMIYNSLEAAGRGVGNVSSSVLDRFTDHGAVSNYARNAVSTLVKLGVINGDNNNRLNPRGTLTRAEAAVILYNVLTM